VGGVMYDATPLVIEKIREFVRTFPKTLADMDRLPESQSDFRRSDQGRWRIDQGEAISGSASGPIARASGVTRDLRKDEPYLAYKDFDFRSAARRPAIVFRATWSAWPKCARA